ncbi:MAG: hypothetical protein M3Y25_06235 [Thermoproteota archaeon]|nr:hypothetical protein [Thermoproteota archaeon]
MLSILIIVSLGLIPLACTASAQSTDKAEGGILDLFDGKSDTNSNVSFVPGENMLGAQSGELRTTPGLSHELNNTVGNRTQFMDPNFEVKSIEQYDSNSSDWTKIHPFDEGRAD